MTREGRLGPSQRQLRVGEALRHALADVFERGEIRDPGLAGLSVTVTEVRVGPDLRTAVVYVIPLGGGDAAAMMDALGRARSFLRRRIAAAVRLKFVPELTFRRDPSFDEADHIEQLLRNPAVARDLAVPEHDPEGGDEDDDGT